MQKKSLLALLLVAMLALSGCALITVDQDVDDARIIIDVNGETVNKKLINSMVEYQISQNEYTNQMYSMYLGIDAGLPTDPATLQPEVINSYVQNLVAQQKIRELGLDQLTEEETALVNDNAQKEYDAFLNEVAAYYLAGEELEGDALKARAEEYALANGLGTKEDYVQSANVEMLFDKLEAYMAKDVSVSEEEVKAVLEERIAADQTAYGTNQDAYVNAAGQTVYYTPDGLRWVKQILVKFTDEDSKAIQEKEAALADAKANADAGVEGADAALAQAEADAAAAWDAAAANIQQKTDEIYALAAAEGADFDALVAEYNEDTGAPAEGYVVGADVTVFVTPFTQGAMALEKVGDVSQPVLTEFGYHILQYAGDLEAGPAKMEDVGEALKAELLLEKQEEVYMETLEDWVAQADVKTYPERLN